MSIKKLLVALALLGASAGSAGAAEDILPLSPGGPGAFTGSLGFTSEYFFRGLSQTDDKPAVQGGLGYTHDFGGISGSVGVWGSNVNFGDATVEMDYTAGLSGTVLGATWNLGAIYYSYPGSTDAGSALDLDFYEGTGGLGYDFGLFALGASVNYSPDFQAESGDAWYLNANVKIPLGKYVDLGAAIGRQYIDKNANFGVRDYTDYKVALSTLLAGFALEAAYVDTSLSDTECSNCGRFVVTVSRTF